jgi:hypothetical protein
MYYYHPMITFTAALSSIYLMGMAAGTVPKTVRCEVKQKSLGEQVACLSKMSDKVMVLRSTVSAAQTLVARSVCMKTLSFLAQRSVVKYVIFFCHIMKFIFK